jgi:hypothetical protein
MDSRLGNESLNRQAAIRRSSSPSFAREIWPRIARIGRGFLTRQVSGALERIDNGSYGLCLQCGQPIEVNRLAALPWVAFCIACQERKAENRVI